MRGRVTLFPDARSLAVAAAERVAGKLSHIVRSGRTATFVLSGGMTPRATYEELPEVARKAKLDWAGVHLFWGDERLVGPEDPASNYRMARNSLLAAIEIPESNIHRIRGELPAASALLEYEEEIMTHFRIDGSHVPRFDLVLLGLGEDGHVASLFPGTAAAEEERRIVAVSRIGMSDRITLTLPVINNARDVYVLVSGTTKAEMLRTLLTGGGAGLPARRITTQSLSWLVDAEAASLLKEVQ